MKDSGGGWRGAIQRGNHEYHRIYSTYLVGSLVAGLLGSLTGLGGGVVIIPLLALAFEVNIRYAIGASLVSVVATSSWAATAYVKEGFSNIRIGMFLEIATTLGALVGVALTAKISTALPWAVRK
jgi:uncharacterized membrane protein YfcA